MSLSTVYSKCDHEYEKMFKEEESIEILKITGSINNIDGYQKINNHASRKRESRISTEKKNWIADYLIKEINRNELMSKNHKSVCRFLNYIDNSLIVISRITGCVSISAFVSLVGIPIGFTISTIGLKIFVITGGIKMYNSINKKNKKKHDKIILLTKSLSR